MMPSKVFPCVALMLAVAAATGSARAHPPAALSVDAKAAAAGGIRSTALHSMQRVAQLEAYGIVLDPGPLLRLGAQIAVARGKLAAAVAQAELARNEAARAGELYRSGHNISQAAFQAARSRWLVARARQAGARVRLGELQSRARNDWGPVLAAAASRSAAPVPQLESGTVRLVEASLALGQALPPLASMASATTPDGSRVTLQLIGPAPRAASGISGPGVYGLMKTRASAPIGTPLTLMLRGRQAVRGVVVPASAVVWQSGRAYVYRDEGHGSFQPVAIAHALRIRQGYFEPDAVSGGLEQGQKVVTAGAALLISASRASRPKAKAGAVQRGSAD